MKKKIKIILIIIAIFILFAIFTGIVDYKRVQTDKAPIFTIKFTNKEKNKFTYIGIGYKIYKNIDKSQNRKYDYKFGSWFMKKPTKKFTIIDETKDKYCLSVMNKIYEDRWYEYFFGCAGGNDYVIKYEDGSKESLYSALNNRNINIKDLDKFGITYFKEKKYTISKLSNKVKHFFHKN